MRLRVLHIVAALSAIFFSLAVSAQNTGEKKPGINPEEKQRVNDSSTVATHAPDTTLIVPITPELPGSSELYEVQDTITRPPAASHDQAVIPPVVSAQESSDEQKKLEDQRKAEEQTQLAQQQKAEDQKLLDQQKKAEKQQHKEEVVKRQEDLKAQKKRERQEAAESRKAERKARKAERKAEREASRQTEAEAEDHRQAEAEAQTQVPAAEPDSTGLVLFGLSSNLLMDAVTAVNLGVEVPVGRNWSLRAEYATPWWGTADKSLALKAQNVNLGARYYLEPWDSRGINVCTGWFASLTVGAGMYDVCLNSYGTQGRGFLGNIGIGYSFPISTWWRLDLAAGAGVMVSEYHDYQVNLDGSITDKEATVTRVPDPTAFKVSFVYLFHVPGKK